MIRTLIALALSALLVAPTAAQRAAPDSAAQISLSFAPVVARAAPAVVNVFTRKVVQRRASPFAGDPFFQQFFRNFGGMPQRRIEQSLGSGVIVRADGLVVTNAHVIENAVEIRVALSDRREFDAEAVLFDRRSDLAVLRLKDAEGLPVLDLADDADLLVGDLVLAIGNPFGVGQTVTMGVISGLGRSRGRAGGYFIQTDAAVNPGNSGGALVDMAGRLTGVNTAILSRSGGSNGIGFAIPAALVRRAVDAALAGQTELARPWAGARGQQITPDIAEAMGLDSLDGVLIAALHPRSPLRAAGVAPGDVVVALDGQPVESPEEFAFRLAALGIGGEATVTVLRKGRRIEATFALTPAPPGSGG